MLALSGCARKWEVQNAPPADVIKYSAGDDYLVVLTNGRQVELREVQVNRDSLIGQLRDDPSGPATNAPLAIALTDVKSIAVRKPDGVATTFWVVTVGVIVLVLSWAAFWSSVD
jgi:hypothetical protein